MRPTVALDVPKPGEILASCKRCGDKGWLDANLPCACKSGVEHATYAALLQSPPSCVDCGLVAEFMLLSETPRCQRCDYRHNTKTRRKS